MLDTRVSFSMASFIVDGSELKLNSGFLKRVILVL